jgi:hypothetical protein
LFLLFLLLVWPQCFFYFPQTKKQMSYDYNALVTQIVWSREQAAAAASAQNGGASNTMEAKLMYLQQSTEAFATLSSHCPMTPLLWMQYASDTTELLQALDTPANEALETRLQLVELGLAEFPGSAILHLHYLELLVGKSRKNGSTRKDDDGGDNSSNPDDKLQQAIETAIENVGKGSHRNEGDWIIVSIYRLAAQFYQSQQGQWSNAIECFHQRAGVPMIHSNESIVAELQQFCAAAAAQKGDASLGFSSLSEDDFHRLDASRRMESKTYNSLIPFEDEVDMAMHSEGVLARHQVPKQKRLEGSPTIELDWDQILAGNQNKFWMGLGGMATADAFIKYALGCARFHVLSAKDAKFHATKNNNNTNENDDDNDFDAEENRQRENKVQALAIPVYERGVAECPTAESLWLSYIRHLTYMVQGARNSPFLSTQLKNVVARSVRNCPYSVTLYQQRIHTELLLAEVGQSVLDPEELMKIVQDAMAMKFITAPSACLDLYLSAIQAMKRRVLSLISTFANVPAPPAPSEKKKNKNKKSKETVLTLRFDEAEPLQKIISSKQQPSASSSTTQKMDESLQQELQDLCEDIREMYDAADAYLRKHQESWSEGRVQLWSDRGETERHLVSLLMEHFTRGAESDDDENDDRNRPVAEGATPKVVSLSKKAWDEAIRCFEKATKVHQPAHPDSYIAFLQTLRACVTSTAPNEVISRLRQVRGVFQKAFQSVGVPKPHHQATSQQQQQYALQAAAPREFDTAFHCLCYDYLAFEKTFGSETSLALASKTIERKLVRVGPTIAAGGKVTIYTNGPEFTATGHTAQATVPVHDTLTNSTADGVGTKRKLDSDEDLSMAKKAKISESKSSTNEISLLSPSMSMEVEEKDDEKEKSTDTETAKEPKPEKHKIQIGKLEYPAHPFTVRVTNLAKETEEMDLVDCFRPKCGAIVHAKIVREKTHNHFGGKAESKGWALIQFEERGSVEKALELHDVIGIREKLVNVERSHVPAVGLVPPGMHRVNPKGKGKNSKRNQKRKEHQPVVGTTEDATEVGENKKEAKIVEPEKTPPVERNEAKAEEKKPTSGNTAGILAFRPRGVSRGGVRRKVKLEVSDSAKDSK